MIRRLAPRLTLALSLALASCASTPAPTSAPGLATTAPASPTVAPAPSSAASAPQASAAPAWRDAVVTHPDPVGSFASQAPGYYCDPCHYLSEDNLFGVGAVSGGFIATGAVTPPASAIALWSKDGASWAPLPGFTAGDGSAALAVAETGGRITLVGHDPSGAAAWTGDLARGWRRAPSQASLAVAYAAGGMTSVVAFDSGFVAGGYRDDPSKAKAAGAVWRSRDGLAWTLDDDAGVFGGGRIMGLTAVGEALIAVGTAGDQIKGPAAAWRWTRSTGWRRASVPPGGGAMRSVVATTTGLVAVGVNANDTGAAVWTSADGSVWQAVPDQPAFHFYELPVRLQALTLVGGTLVAAGWRSDPGKGSSVVISSSDGRAWQALPWQPSFSGGQVDALATSNATVVAAGRVGYPDDDKAAIWVRAWP